VKVLLVQSYLGGCEPLVYPIALACLKANLDGHDVSFFDTNTSLRPFQDLKKAVSFFQPDVVGVSLRNIDSTNKRKVVYYYGYLKDTVSAIRDSSDAKIVVGGSGFSMFAKQIMEDEPGIDYGIALEGERAFPELLENLDRPEKARSVFYRRNGEVVFSDPGEQIDLNSMYFPDRKSIPLEAYRETPEAIGIETKRGCILDCVYCIYGFLNGKKLRPRDPVKVVNEIETLNKEYGLERFTFIDSVFNIPQKHAEEICREIMLRGLKVSWSAWFNEKGITRGFVELLRDAGCKNIILSPDGFSDTVLNRLGKNITMEDILRTYRIMKDIGGFEVSYNFFKNPPGQTLGTFLSLMAFYFKAKRELGRRVHFEFNSIRIEPHTRLHKVALSEGVISKDENLLYPKYYSNRGTRYIEGIFNLMLRIKGK
jgi:putative variant cofactor biosynthesis B12-binding/radical SAM domain protein 1